MITRLLSTWLMTILLCSFFPASAQQGIPIIKRYSVETYHAGIENWDAVQDQNGLMYFANSEGILEFDGVFWRLIQTPNLSKIRTLAGAGNEKIYVGGDSELGYLEKDRNGQKKYVSLLQQCPPEYRHYCEHIWKIIIAGNKRFFLAGGAVLVFNEKDEFEKILQEDIYLRSFILIKDRIYAYSNTKGLLSLDINTLTISTFCKDAKLLNRSIEFISPHPEGGIRIHIFDEGFYRINQGLVSLEKSNNHSTLDTDYIFCQGRAEDLLFVGTTINGVYALDPLSLDIKYHFTQSLGLNDNKIFSINTDHDNNVWICHENGLSFIEVDSPVRLINEKLGIRGTGYCTITFDSTLFVGTSHGLFSCRLGSKEGFYNFSLFKQIRQPIYFLEKRGDNLLIGCLLEIFVYDGKELKTISKTRDNNKIVTLPGTSDHFIISYNNGFLLLKYDNGFHLIRKIEGIEAEIHDFDVDQHRNIWAINTDHKLLVAQLNAGLDSFAVSGKINDNYKDWKYLAVSNFKNKLIIASSKGLYEFDDSLKSLKSIEKDLQNQPDTFVVNWLFNQNNENLWYEKTFYSKGKLKYRIDNLSEEKDLYKLSSINTFIYGNKAFSFGKLNTSELAIGTSGGFLLFDLNFHSGRLTEAEAYIRKMVVTDNKDTTVLEGVWTGETNTYELPLHQEYTQVELHCASNFFNSHENILYSYKLEGSDKDWSDWVSDNKLRYTVNGDGEFIFKIRATSNYNTVSNTTTYKFIINKPWYKTFWWYCIEIGILAIIMSVSVYLNRKGTTKISKASAILLVLMILTFFEIASELVQDWIDAQGVTIFALRIAINIFIALSINPIESWARKKLIKPVREQHQAEHNPVI